MLPPSVEAARQAGINDIDVLEAVDYYKTPRDQDPHGATSFLFSRRAASKDKELLVLPDTSHYELYDQPEATTKALGKVVPFFRRHLTA